MAQPLAELPIRRRLTVRSLMAAVAGLGLLLGAWKEVPKLVERHDRYSSRARIWAAGERDDLGFLRDVPYTFRELKDTPSDRDHRSALDAQVRRVRARLPHIHALRRKYEHAARHPWIEVGPDPPEVYR